METAASPSPLAGFVPLIAIFLIFYFLVIRPQQKQQSEHQKMLEALRKGDRIVTTGGLHGAITALRGPDLEVKIAENCKVVISRSAVAKRVETPQLASAEHHTADS